MRIEAHVEIGAILNSRGLGSSDRARVHLANTVARLADPYVPKAQGTLKNTRRMLEGGKGILYNQPYAHYQYYGQVMAGRAPKQYTGRPIDYHGGPMRGKAWDKRMLADRGDEVIDDLANFVGGRRR